MNMYGVEELYETQACSRGGFRIWVGEGVSGVSPIRVRGSSPYTFVIVVFRIDTIYFKSLLLCSGYTKRPGHLGMDMRYVVRK